MSLRGRITIGSGVIVAVAAAIISCVVFLSTRTTLKAQVDASLRERVATVTYAAPRSVDLPLPASDRETPNVTAADTGQSAHVPAVPPPPLGGAGGYTQYVFAERTSGSAHHAPTVRASVPPTREDLAVAAQTRSSFFSDRSVAGTQVRVLTVNVAPGTAALIVRPLTELDAALRRFLWVFLAVSAGATLAGAALGRLIASRALAPVRCLSVAAKHVEATTDLSQRIAITGRDELASLGESFNRMLDSLERSKRAQRDLVADASHELRTPLTSLRTNLDVLGEFEDVPSSERCKLIADARAQAEELTDLISDVVTLAQGDTTRTDHTQLSLDALVRTVVERARRRDRQRRLDVWTTPSVVHGDGDALERAVSNMIDNAMKWGPKGTPITVTVADGAVRVSDAGPGFDPADLPRAFDRFYRGASSRAKPGSGLGLAIVQQVAQQHGGHAAVTNRPDGGAIVELKLPTHG